MIALASLPSHAAEFGRDEEVRSLLEAVFGTVLPAAATTVANDKGGKFIFVPETSLRHIADALAETGCDADIVFPNAGKDEAGFINYTHKQRDGRDFYFIANTTDKAYTDEISLRGEARRVELWNPHTGAITPAEYRTENGRTLVKAAIPAVRSCFIVTGQ